MRTESRTRTRALGYIRVSSYLGRDRDDALTEAVQLEKIEQWCAVADLDLVDVLRDIDRSGKDFDAKGRPQFDELMRRLEAGEASAVVVYRMARFGRDFYETVRTVRRLRERGIQFHSASERIDLESANGRLMFNVMASFDEYELELRREYWAETKARVVQERGVHLGRTPLGYLRASKRPKHACDVTIERAAEILRELGSARDPVSGGLVPDPELAPAIRRAFASRASGARLGEVIAQLEAEAPRSEGKAWTSTQVARMMRLRAYLGEVNHGKLVARDAHEPIVDAQTFAAAQRVPRRRAPRSPSASFPLRGAIRCAGCGFPMTGWNQPRTRADGRIDRVRAYRCVRQRTNGRCEARAVVSADAVERIVRDELEPLARELTATIEVAVEDERLAAVQADLDRLGDRLRSLTDDLEAELDGDVWQEMVVGANRRRRELLAERSAILTGLDQSTSTVTWNDLDSEEQFEIMLRAVDAVVIRRTRYRGEPTERRVAICEAGSISHLFPGPANGWRLQPIDPEASPLAGVSA